MQITVYSSVTGQKDSIVDEQATGNARFVMFSDIPLQSKVWEHQPAYSRFTDQRRNSRAPKILSHLYTDTEYSIYIDGNMQLLRTPEDLVETYLRDHDIALFNHTGRDCIYEEATKCAVAGLDDPETIIEQASYYEKRGYSKHKGLCECGFIIRRHTPRVREFNNEWWAQYSRFSCRDQLSFMFAVDQVGIRLNVIREPWMLAVDGHKAVHGDIINMYPHTILNPVVK